MLPNEPVTSGLPPVHGPRIHTLVLGSLPSRASLAIGEYYGHPRNGFWPIMGRLLDAGPEHDYAERCRRLVAAGVGLWDVLESSIRPGSLDANIRSDTATANDFASFVAGHARLERLIFNGRAAETLFMRKVAGADPALCRDLRLVSLPSTSPANAAMPFAEKLRRWSLVTGGLAVR